MNDLLNARRAPTTRLPAKLAAIALLAAGLIGCADGPMLPDPAALAAARDGLVLAAEPEGGVTALDWFDERETASADAAASEDGRITLVGVVGGMPNPFGADVEPDFPWRAGEAAFYVVDPATAAEFSSHADEAGDDHAADCPFCAREAASKARAAVAVLFKNEAGDLLPYDARDLFGLQKDELVVVTGEWSLAGDMLVVKADGLFRRE